MNKTMRQKVLKQKQFCPCKLHGFYLWEVFYYDYKCHTYYYYGNIIIEKTFFCSKEAAEVKEQSFEM